jgi:hypothetical protein
MVGLTPQVLDIALSYMEGLDCARSLTVAILLREGDWAQLTSLEVIPAHYTSHDLFRRSVAATEFLRKFDGLPTGRDLPAITFDKWLWAEKECFHTNRLLNEFMDLGTLRGRPASSSFRSFVDAVRKTLSGSSVKGRHRPGKVDSVPVRRSVTLVGWLPFPTKCHRLQPLLLMRYSIWCPGQAPRGRARARH